MTEPRFLAGRLLLAMPGMGDPRFDQAVIAMCVHDTGGALGIGIGTLHPGLRLRALLGDLGIGPGAGERSRGFLVHSPEWIGEDTIVVDSGRDGSRFGLSASRNVLEAIASGK